MWPWPQEFMQGMRDANSGHAVLAWPGSLSGGEAGDGLVIRIGRPREDGQAIFPKASFF